MRRGRINFRTVGGDTVQTVDGDGRAFAPATAPKRHRADGQKAPPGPPNGPPASSPGTGEAT